MTKYAIKAFHADIKFDAAKTIPGCAIPEDTDPETLFVWDDLASAKEDLATYTADLNPLRDGRETIRITEYAIEVYEVDDEGDFISGSDYYLGRWPDRLTVSGKDYYLIDSGWMSRADIIAEHFDELTAEMVTQYSNVLHLRGSFEYEIYITPGGHITVYERLQGSNNFLRFDDDDDRIYVTTISMPHYDPFDAYDAPPRPEDEKEREELESDLIDDEIMAYRQNVADILNDIIRDAD